MHVSLHVETSFDGLLLRELHVLEASTCAHQKYKTLGATEMLGQRAAFSDNLCRRSSLVSTLLQCVSPGAGFWVCLPIAFGSVTLRSVAPSARRGHSARRLRAPTSGKSIGHRLHVDQLHVELGRGGAELCNRL